jgi:hypothetical protein
VRVYYYGGGEIVVPQFTNDVIEVTSLNMPDETWEYKDKKGHWHKFSNGKLPSLKLVVDSPDTEEYPPITHYECRLCGESVFPRYKSSTNRQFVSGLWQ